MRLCNVPELGGRSLCSSQTYERGDVVILKEKPHVSFPSKPNLDSNYSKILDVCKGVIKKYGSDLDPEAVAACAHACAAPIKCRIQEFDEYYAPKEPSPALIEIANDLDSQNSSALIKFILVNLFNSHHRDGQILLYARISKMAHSCSPNIRLRFDSETELSAIAIRRIECDEPLTFSYLSEGLDDVDGLIWGSVSDRRSKLRRTKQFDCQCVRCVKESTSESLLAPILPREVRASLANYFNTLEPRLVDWAELRRIKNEGSGAINKVQLAGLTLALARQDLVDIPERYGQGIAISDGKLEEGAQCAASILPEEYDQGLEGLILSGLMIFIPQFARQFNRIPKNLRIKTEIVQNLEIFLNRADEAAVRKIEIFSEERLTQQIKNELSALSMNLKNFKPSI